MTFRTDRVSWRPPERPRLATRRTPSALKRSVGPWIGEAIALAAAEPHAPRAEVVRLASLVERPPPRRFARAHDLCDGHLRTLVLRAGHALGLLT